MAILLPGFCAGGILNRTLPPPLRNPHAFPSLSLEQQRMSAALETSMASIGIANPNPAVGCQIFKDDVEIAHGSTEAYGSRHAERVAFEALKHSNTHNLSVYVTLEPCSHFGKQPPCVDLFTKNQVREIFVATRDPNHLVDGQGLQRLRELGISVKVGLLQNEVRAWLLPFFVNRIFKRPFFALKWAQSLDGNLADETGTSKWISGASARAYTHWLRQKYDVILVGARTFLVDLPKLDVRDCAQPIQNFPTRMLFDPHGALLNADKALQFKLEERSLNSPLLYLVNASRWNENSSQWKRHLERKNLLLPYLLNESLDRFCQIETALRSELCVSLRKRPVESVFVEGGPTLVNALLERGFADCLHSFVAPLVLGGHNFRIGNSTRTDQQNAFPRSLAQSARFKLLSTAALNDDVLVELISEGVAKQVFENPKN